MRPEGSWPTVEAEHPTAALEGQWGSPTPSTPGLTWGSPEGFKAEAAPVPQLRKRRRGPASAQPAGDAHRARPVTQAAAAARGAGTASCARGYSIGISINGCITSFPFKSLINNAMESKILRKLTL